MHASELGPFDYAGAPGGRLVADADPSGRSVSSAMHPERELFWHRPSAARALQTPIQLAKNDSQHRELLTVILVILVSAWIQAQATTQCLGRSRCPHGGTEDIVWLGFHSPSGTAVISARTPSRAACAAEVSLPIELPRDAVSHCAVPSHGVRHEYPQNRLLNGDRGVPKRTFRTLCAEDTSC